VVTPTDAAGRYPITVTARYTWGRHVTATTTSTLIATVVTAPGTGRGA
jgi:hypothetical protein